MANAEVFIHQFPDGLNTLVGERGIMLSGGYIFCTSWLKLWFELTNETKIKTQTLDKIKAKLSSIFISTLFLYSLLLSHLM